MISPRWLALLGLAWSLLLVGAASAQGGIYYEYTVTQDVEGVLQAGDVVCVPVPYLAVRVLSYSYGNVASTGACTTGSGVPGSGVKCVTGTCYVVAFLLNRNTAPDPTTISPLTGLPSSDAVTIEFDSSLPLEKTHSWNALHAEISGMTSTPLVQGIVVMVLAVILGSALMRTVRQVMVDEISPQLAPADMEHEEHASLTQSGYDGRE